MVSIHKISFKGDLLNNVVKKNTSTQTPLKLTTNSNEILIKPNDTNKNETKNSSPFLGGNKLAIASSVISMATLGIGIVYLTKHGKLIQQLKQVSRNNSQNIKNIGTEITNNISVQMEKINNKISQAGTKLEKNVNELNERISGLGKWQDGQISGLREDLSRRISGVMTPVKGGSVEEIMVSPVMVNGQELRLASVMHEYGKNTEKLEHALRSESTKTIFGFNNRINIPKGSITLRMPTSEFKGFSSTGGMAVVPREIVANLGAIVNGKQQIRLIVDTPMYIGQVEDNVFYSIQKRADGLFDYVTSKTGKPFVEGLEKIGTMRLPIYTDKGKTTEFVDMFLARDIEQVVDLDLLKPWLSKGLQKELRNAEKTGNAFELNWNALKIKYNPEKGDIKPTARVKYDTVFYHNDKFNMDGPVVQKQTKNIYNNLTHNSGETERFIYFDKYFYEGLLHSEEAAAEKLGADVIIGNDWQTGAISAMLKLLTTAKKSFGLDPKIADKVYNTPIVTIIHNAGLAGNVWHSQDKLLNVMFGEHAAMITKNAWMPKNVSLGVESLNGLFHGSNLNPQTMASVYSDVLIPVSKGYGHEMASHSGFGGANHDIFRMRARYHEYSDIEHLKYIARQNGFNPELVTSLNTAYRPITNGCDRVNNMLTDKAAVKLQQDLGITQGSIRPKISNESVFEFHQHNKEGYLNKVIADVNTAKTGKSNPMNIELPELTDLTGVTKDTMVVSTAGRIVDQKGLDIWAESIEEFLSRHQGGDLPVFYTQGVGDQVFIDKLLEVKRRVASRFGKQASDRIVFAKLFSEPGRYDGCKLMSDFTVMSSWFEPCGLVHKEISSYSGAIPIVNKVGGLTDGLENGVNAIFSEFRPKFENYNDALNFNRHAFANALDEAYNLYNNKEKFKRVLENSYNANHSWLKKGGAMEEYAKVLVDLKVLKPEVLKFN